MRLAVLASLATACLVAFACNRDTVDLSAEGGGTGGASAGAGGSGSGGIGDGYSSAESAETSIGVTSPVGLHFYVQPRTMREQIPDYDHTVIVEIVDEYQNRVTTAPPAEITLALTGRSLVLQEARVVASPVLTACNTFDQPRAVTTRALDGVRVAGSEVTFSLPPGSVAAGSRME